MPRRKNPKSGTNRFGVKSGNMIGGDPTSFAELAADVRKARHALLAYKCVHGKLWRNRKCRICMEPK